VCVEGGSAESHILKQQYPSIPQVDVMNNDEGLRLVREGRCCAAAMPQFIFDLQKRDFELNGDCAFEFVGRPLTRSGGAFASQTGVSYCTQMVRNLGATKCLIHMLTIVTYASPSFCSSRNNFDRLNSFQLVSEKHKLN
jgi:hypothetical protein